MSAILAEPRRYNVQSYQILDIADVAPYVPAADPDQGDTTYGLTGGGVQLYSYDDPDDGFVIFEATNGYIPKQEDYIITNRDQGGYRYGWIVEKVIFEATFDFDAAPI